MYQMNLNKERTISIGAVLKILTFEILATH